MSSPDGATRKVRTLASSQRPFDSSFTWLPTCPDKATLGSESALSSRSRAPLIRMREPPPAISVTVPIAASRVSLAGALGARRIDDGLSPP